MGDEEMGNGEWDGDGVGYRCFIDASVRCEWAVKSGLHFKHEGWFFFVDVLI